MICFLTAINGGSCLIICILWKDYEEQNNKK